MAVDNPKGYLSLNADRPGSTGLESVSRQISSWLKTIEGGTKAGLLAAGNDLLKASKDIVPVAMVNGGTLRRSGYVAPFEGPGFVAVEVGYNTTYAPFVHEINKHYTRPGSSWKYLQKPMIEGWANFVETVASYADVGD